MKKYFLLALFTSMLTSCKKCGDCDLPCSRFDIAISIIDKESGFDATGDSIGNPFVKYILDSIKYQVIVKMDTSEMLTPNTITMGDFNVFNISLEFSDYNIDNATGLYYFIIHLNKYERDTVKISYQNGNDRYDIFQNDSLWGSSACEKTNYLMKLYK